MHYSECILYFKNKLLKERTGRALFFPSHLSLPKLTCFQGRDVYVWNAISSGPLRWRLPVLNRAIQMYTCPVPWRWWSWSHKTLELAAPQVCGTKDNLWSLSKPLSLASKPNSSSWFLALAVGCLPKSHSFPSPCLPQWLSNQLGSSPASSVLRTLYVTLLSASMGEQKHIDILGDIAMPSMNLTSGSLEGQKLLSLRDFVSLPPF